MTRRSLPSNDSILLADQMRAQHSVCIHIRCYHEINGSTSIPINYFRSAIAYVNQYIEKPHFYIFTDDHDWVERNLKMTGASKYTNVRCNTTKGYIGAMDDLWLMNQCRHHILSSSSFSWWGAWLAESDDGLVIAPRNSDFNDRGTFLPNWILL